MKLQANDIFIRLNNLIDNNKISAKNLLFIALNCMTQDELQSFVKETGAFNDIFPVKSDNNLFDNVLDRDQDPEYFKSLTY